MTLIDSEHRSQATDPRSSFIVQAPAGSGKTEILTQRYLRLLSTVTAPEQIIALTFTRKAASEMRERILFSLQQAADNIQPGSPHQQMTLSYASQALTRSERFQWDLLQQPTRLKIITIDSLCQSINQAIPLLEQQISYSQICDKPDSFYLKAARTCIQFAIATPEYQQAIKSLLLHVDNKQDNLIELFIKMLAQRDQWLSLLFHAREQDKSAFEYALKVVEEHELARFHQSIPVTLSSEVILLVRELAQSENNPQSSRYILKDFYDFKQVNQVIAQGLCDCLLDSNKKFRKSFDHHVGLVKSNIGADQYQKLKSASIDLLGQLNEYPDFLNALLQISQLPNPVYADEQWKILQALFQILPLLAGHLHVLFSEHNEVDFTAISQQALKALGETEAPTDLALYLDHAIHHILVDEFQDTSITQYELLTRLVQGWEVNEGKTLFLVGDPMQSIYRFRQAEVGLFFRAQNEGIGAIKLKPLKLTCNFRSTDTIVDWVNTHFAKIFPQQFDMETGAVSFLSSRAITKSNQRSAIHALEFKTKEEEAKKLIEIIQHELESNPDKSIAILVRSRSRLHEIVKLLRQYQIPFQGTDIELLANLTHLRDVWSLTKALLSPGNRLSWLEVLRSPYCGLALNDLHHIAQFDKNKSIYSALLQTDKITDLSEEGRYRLRFFIEIMHQALSRRYQNRLSDWVAKTLKDLHVEYILNPDERKDLDQFWVLLDRYEQEGRLPDITEVLNEFKILYSKQVTPSPLQIMTIHKSKGLEFDTVILPGLGSQANNGDRPLLRWLQLPTQNHGNLLLVSPVQAAYQDHCLLYDYLERLDKEKERYETQRLLYVAVTRAKSRLYLCDCSTKAAKSSFRSLLSDQIFTDHSESANNEMEPVVLPKLSRLPLEFYQTFNKNLNQKLNAPVKGITSGIPRLTGIITHQLMQWICDNHPSSPDQIPWNLAHYQFNKLGLNKELQQILLLTIQNQIHKLFHDPTGSWIIAQHEQEHNEYELLVEYENKLATRIIDRTFIADSKLWIIDFKTGKEDLISLNQHQKQLNDYGYYLSSRSNLPIQCGLYYLVNGHWITWEYGSHPALQETFPAYNY